MCVCFRARVLGNGRYGVKGNAYTFSAVRLAVIVLLLYISWTEILGFGFDFGFSNRRQRICFPSWSRVPYPSSCARPAQKRNGCKPEITLRARRKSTSKWIARFQHPTPSVDPFTYLLAVCVPLAHAALAAIHLLAGLDWILLRLFRSSLYAPMALPLFAILYHFHLFHAGAMKRKARWEKVR